MNHSQDTSLQSGNSQSSDAVVSGLWSNYGNVRRWVAASISNSMAGRADADDVMQDAFTEVCKNADELAKKDQVASLNWLSLVAKRKLIDQIRSANAKRRKAPERTTVSSDEVDIHAIASTPSSFVARREAKELLLTALSQLSDRHRLVVQLRYFEDRTYADVSEQMEISVEAAQMLTKRALRKLKGLLGNRSRLLN